ncbi:MAG: carbohydrate binding family 9 domain-containing protein, partial [Pseudomonadota bacterium]
MCALLLVAATEAATAQDVFAPPDAPTRYLALLTGESIAVDGQLDELVWQRAEPITEFIQKDPNQGDPITYSTAVRVAYDDTALYIAAICHQPRDAARVQNLKRDFSYDDNDLFGVAIDGFMDQRNAVVFQTTPYGSQRDMEVIDGSEFNPDWDARWNVKTRIEDDRWVAEIAIPWRNLRYPSGAEELGVIFARNIRSLNEKTSAPAVPRVFTIYRMAYQGVLTGLQTPPPSTNLQLNPYTLVQRVDGDVDSSTDFEVGGELKWAITQSTVLD